MSDNFEIKHPQPCELEVPITLKMPISLNLEVKAKPPTCCIQDVEGIQVNNGYERIADSPEVEPTISLFKTGVLARRALELGLLDLRTASDYDQKPWGLLYKALVDSLGVDSNNFQLIYPFTSWDWPTENVGFISSVQYDFCSTVPHWSAVGTYTSSADRFNQAYQNFLNVIVPATDDPVLRRRIEEANNVLTAAANGYDTALNQAKSVYKDSVTDNNPTFSAWLGTREGKGWQTRITSADTKMQQAQKNLDALVAQANTPGLKEAQKQFKNQDFYSKLHDPGLKDFPKVPNWSISKSSQSWVDSVKAGEGPAGGTISFSNRDQSYDYSNTWAGGSLSIQKCFWEVNVAGKWQRIQQFESDQSLSVNVVFAAVDQISIQPSDWYNGSFVRSKANGPFTRGYSADGGDGTQPVFGEKGFIGLMKTGMYVCYKPSFTITTSKSTFNSFKETFEAATALRIGPFSFSAAGGSTRANWKASQESQSFTGQSTSETPLIFGVTINKLPSQPPTPNVVSEVVEHELSAV